MVFNWDSWVLGNMNGLSIEQKKEQHLPLTFKNLAMMDYSNNWSKAYSLGRKKPSNRVGFFGF